MTTTIERPKAQDMLHERLFQAIDGNNWDDLETLFDADCVYERPGYDAIVGIKDLLHFYRDERIIANGKHNVERVAEFGNVFFCEGEFQGVSRTGEKLRERFVDRYILSGKRIQHRQTYFYRAAI